MCMPYMCALYVCLTNGFAFYTGVACVSVLHVCLICMPYMYVNVLCLICTSYHLLLSWEASTICYGVCVLALRVCESEGESESERAGERERGQYNVASYKAYIKASM